MQTASRSRFEIVSKREDRIARLHALLNERIVFLDGAMGTMIQTYKLTEDRLPGPALRGA